MSRANKFNQPYIALKFGGIKSIDFKGGNSEIRLKYYSGIERTKEDEIEIIKIYKGNFYFWWEDRWGTREEAIDYITNYKHEL